MLAKQDFGEGEGPAGPVREETNGKPRFKTDVHHG